MGGVERTGVTARYRLLRNAVRQRYKQTRRLTEAARHDPLVNPGQAWVSKISSEPVIFREVLNEMMRPALTHAPMPVSSSTGGSRSGA